MSIEPTQPMSTPTAPADAGRPEEESQQPDADQSEAAAEAGKSTEQADAGQPDGVQPAQPSFEPAQQDHKSAQPSFEPAQQDFQAQPSFQPAQQDFHPAQPSFQPAQQHDFQSAQAGFQSAQPGQAPPAPGWPAQPPQYTPQPGWPPQGPGSGKTRGRRGSRRGRAAYQGYPGYPGGQQPRRRHRGRRWVMALFALIVVLILLTIVDRVALAVAENQIANQAQANGLQVKPSVTIEGFPFLTQLIARDFRKVDMSASNVPAGPVNITSLKATLTGVHLNSSYNEATVDHLVATAFVSFSDLAGGGGGAPGISMSAAGPDKVKITANVGPLSDTEVAKISQTGPNEISIQVQNGSPVSGLLSSFGNFSFSLPKLPASVHITGFSVTPQGVTLAAAAEHAILTNSSS
jgi:hypothetical protein